MQARDVTAAEARSAVGRADRQAAQPMGVLNLSLMGTAMQKPLANYVGTYVTMWNLLLRDRPMDGWRAMSKWANDSAQLSAEPSDRPRRWLGLRERSLRRLDAQS
jgi:hypothetical protein